MNCAAGAGLCADPEELYNQWNKWAVLNRDCPFLIIENDIIRGEDCGYQRGERR